MIAAALVFRASKCLRCTHYAVMFVKILHSALGLRRTRESEIVRPAAAELKYTYLYALYYYDITIVVTLRIYNTVISILSII